MIPKSPRKESDLQDLAAGTHGQISCQEHPVADDMENRLNADQRVPTGFGVVGAEAKNGYAGIRDDFRPIDRLPTGDPVSLYLSSLNTLVSVGRLKLADKASKSGLLRGPRTRSLLKGLPSGSRLMI